MLCLQLKLRIDQVQGRVQEMLDKDDAKATSTLMTGKDVLTVQLRPASAALRQQHQ